MDENPVSRVYAVSGRDKAGMSDDLFHQQLTDHLTALRRYAFVLTRSADEAEDLLQDCLAKAVASAAQWRPGSDLKAWLFRILYTCHISRRRRQQVRLRSVTSLEAEMAEPSQPPDQLARLEAARVVAKLETLPEGQRQAILMVAVEDLKYEDAARRLGIPIGTFMSRIARGREALRRALEGEERPALRVLEGGKHGQ
ncbi:RNA polymerase (plasmid) [Niveispirillum cyanobacteriorum]|uniref:RNA polymerase n=2 Tax=Niveispirillum cyanobacteriorum TaxID=1612173 RepID=A0A2K9NL12_9PROT|nr:RNA polymerase [Niveispirillum cyanobacteriorum]GGE82607.1 RNA polymerase sigma factor [Niveispirillum cyanobacteriorum]